MRESEEEMRRQLSDYQQLQQQLQLVLVQKQQTTLQLQELEKAKESLDKSSQGAAYRFVGGFFIPKEKEQLEKELEEEKEGLDLRQKTLEKQEEKLTERLESIKKWFDKLQKQQGENAKTSS